MPDDLGNLLSQLSDVGQGQRDVRFRTGRVVSWNATTGENTISVGGAVIPDVPSLNTADSVLIKPGDVVAMFRYQTQYFVVGRVTRPGQTRALAIRAAQNGGVITPTTTSFAVYPQSAQLTDVYVGSSRNLLVMANAFLSVDNNTVRYSVQITGDSEPGIPDGLGLTSNTADVIQLEASTIQLFQGVGGLNQGTHTITAVAKRGIAGGGAPTITSGTLFAMAF